MNNLEFMQTVLGDEGYYCIVGLNKDLDRPVQKFYQKLDEAIRVAEELQGNGYDAYYALATFEDGRSRKQANVHQLRSLYLDLDCGLGKPYETQQEAIKDLKRFCKETNMPRPYVVNSGGGVHVYWPLEVPVTRAEWIPLAEQLKFLCDTHDLHADPVVTADSARILRVPGTSNFKGEEPRNVSVLYTGAESGTVDSFKAILGEPIKLKKAYIPRGEMDDVTKAVLGNRTTYFKNIVLKTIKGNGCEQLRYIIEHQSTMSEYMWRAGLSIAKFCEDADSAIERISRGHPDYSPEVTYNKVMGIKEGPYRCVTFNRDNPGLCTECPHWGKITSPIAIGGEIREATDEDNIVEDVLADVDQGHTQTYVIPKYPAPYFRGKTGGVYKRIIKQDDEIEVLIYHNDIYVIDRLDDPDMGESIVVRLHLPKDGVREFTMPLTAVTSKEEFRRYMASKGVAVVKTDELSSYIITWVNSMQLDNKVSTAHRQFGWVDDTHQAFILGDKEIRADRVDHNPPTAVTGPLFKAFAPKGSLEEWKKAINFYNRPDMELHQFVIGMGFGSIFTDFTAVNAGILHIYSPDSGIGKTTSLQAAMSIWGDPTKLVLKESDTVNSKMNRAELYNNIMLALDEMTNSHPKDISDFAYQYTSGMQRNRLTMSANQERVRGEPWKQMAVSTGNTSMIEKMQSYKSLPKGEAMRILEIRAVPVTGISKIETDVLSSRLLNNYGHAAIVYLQSFMGDIEAVKKLYEDTRKQIDGTLGFSYMERFYSVIVTNAFVGLKLAKMAGLIDFDLKALVKWLKNTVRGVKVRNETLELDAETLLTEFMSENINNMLRIKSTDDARYNESSDDMDHLIIPDATPRMQFVARFEYDIKQLYIYPNHIRDWCVRKQISYEGFYDALRAGRTKAKMEKKRMGTGTRFTVPATTVLRVDCSGLVSDEMDPTSAQSEEA